MRPRGRKKMSQEEKAFHIRQRLVPETCPCRVTRSMSKKFKSIQDVVVMEVYRCMPLLGDEEEVPHWDVHIAKYDVKFI